MIILLFVSGYESFHQLQLFCSPTEHLQILSLCPNPECSAHTYLEEDKLMVPYLLGPYEIVSVSWASILMGHYLRLLLFSEALQLLKAHLQGCASTLRGQHRVRKNKVLGIMQVIHSHGGGREQPPSHVSFSVVAISFVMF